jgi:single-stranded-DNA-specific exonuclease
MKKWEIQNTLNTQDSKFKIEDIITILLKNRELVKKKDIDVFFQPTKPEKITSEMIGIDSVSFEKGISRIRKAIKKRESIVVYADYDADGITAGAIMWETIHHLGGKIMPYIPHRVEEGYGLSVKGISTVIKQYNPSLIITVDHGISAKDSVDYAKSKGIDVIVTDHHVKPDKLPDCSCIHTTMLCGAGISWFVTRKLQEKYRKKGAEFEEHIALAAIGTIADMMPLKGVNRTIAKYGLEAIRKTQRIGLSALIFDAGLQKDTISTHDISHILAPRINAMGRLVHAMDALRLLCTRDSNRAAELARTLSLTNKERQQLTIDTTMHADSIVKSRKGLPKLLFVSHESYNQGVIGLVAGKLVEVYYRPAIVLSRGKIVSKASARSIAGFNIVEAIRTCSDILVDVGGHPMAAGFTVETKYLQQLQDRLEQLADKELSEEQLTRILGIDTEIPLEAITEELWERLRSFEPFGFGNPEPVFATRGVAVDDARLVGGDGKHLKLTFSQPTTHNLQPIAISAIAFGLGDYYPRLRPDKPVDIAYTIDMNVWNGTRSIQLKIKDIHI